MPHFRGLHRGGGVKLSGSEVKHNAGDARGAG